jgi:hypothetical protein
MLFLLYDVEIVYENAGTLKKIHFGIRVPLVTD